MTFNIHHLAVHPAAFKPHPVHHSPAQHTFTHTMNSIHDFGKQAARSAQVAERKVATGVKNMAHDIATTERSIVNDAGRFVQNTTKSIEGITTGLSMPLLIGGAVVVGAVLLTSRR